jgi:probable rRNA maturation factor
MIHITIDEEFGTLVDLEPIEQAVRTTLLQEASSPDADLTVAIENEEVLHALNQQFLGIDAPTDVLAFPSDTIDPETQMPYLGDVIIAYPIAAAQALSVSADITAEIQLLTVHGVLHLLGFDHATAQQKREMWTAQERVLAKLGLHFDQLPE